MKFIVIFLGIILSSLTSWSQCSTLPIDLNSWTVQGGTWNVNAAGTSVNQTVNGGKVYFLSPQPFVNVIINGKFKTEDADDDAIGFVFGVEGTIGTGNFHYYLLSWDEGGFTGGGLFIDEYDQTGLVSSLLALPGNHWTRAFAHNFTIQYQSTKIIVILDGVTLLDIDGCFNPGQFGFYNNSQANTTYWDFMYLPKTDFQFVSTNKICIYEPAETEIFCLSTIPNPYAEIRWDFGDGTIYSNNLNPSHNYSAAGVYDVKLYTRDFLGCEDSLTKQLTVFDPSFTLGPDQNICPGSSNATFTSSHNKPGNTYNWSSGETTPSITKNIADEYRLILTDANGCKATDTVNLTIEALPTVSFTSSNECLYDTVTFTNTTVGATSILWEFGDGTSSTLESPKHKFLTVGDQNVKLIATFGQGCKDSITQVITFFELPLAGFSFVNDCYNIETDFNNSSTISSGTITDWEWSFGDGSIGNLENESHLYTSDGDFDTELIVTSDNNCKDTIIQTITRFPVPVVSYTANPECEYNSVQFNETSTINTPDVLVGWEWDFGSGLTANNQSPAMLFPTAGTYPVKLVVTSSNGCKDSISNTINSYPKPVANFISSDDCNNIAAAFINSTTVSSGIISDWKWDLGDGTNSSAQNLMHNYVQPNTYTVQLIVTTNNNCKDTIAKTVVRHPVPHASFTYANACAYNELPFTNQSTIANGNSIVDYNWNFGDGSMLNQNEHTTHLFVNSGVYQVNLSVRSNNNCLKDTSINVEVYAVPKVNFITSDKCINVGPSVFNNGSSITNGSFTSWNWDFGNGATSPLLNPTYQYSNIGTYNVTLIGTSDHGCRDTMVKEVKIFNKPTANFTVDKPEDCIPLCVNFIDASLDDTSISFWEWSFENHEASLSKNPALCITNEGTYDVSLIVTNMYNCKDTLIEVDFLTAWPNPIADFELSSQNTDLLHPVITLTNFSFDAQNWLWDFGDHQNNSTDYDLLHIYEEAGVYPIQLWVENQYGCTDSLTKIVKVRSVAFHYVPNSFSPNGDGINDVFKVEADDFNFKSMSIFDRWGKIIFKSEDINQGWDGSTNGSDSKGGTYVWVLRYVDKLDNDQIDRGNVTLIK